jgi:hypothetical protein
MLACTNFKVMLQPLIRCRDSLSQALAIKPMQ